VSKNTFVNPYTFIPLGDECVRNERECGDFTGVLYCTLETITPLIIPNTSNEHAFPAIEVSVIKKWNDGKTDNEKVKADEHKSYEFFTYENPQGDRSDVYSRPIIPGSSLRGMIRSVFESVTDSCMSTVDEEAMLHRRSPEAYKKYGIIRDGKLFQADKVLIHTDAAWHSDWDDAPRFSKSGSEKTPILKMGTELWITRSDSSFYSSRGFSTGNKWVTSINAKGVGEKGYFLAGEQFGTGKKKHFDSVIVETVPTKAIYTLNGDDKERIYSLHNLYQENRSHAYSGWSESDPMPVYYDSIGKEYYFSPACISQEILHRKLGAMIGDFRPCKNVKAPCKACSVFGMVAGNEGALSSRVLFCDALPIDCSNYDEWFDAPKTLPILGTPHITSSEFYQVDPDPKVDYFNADYKVTNHVKLALTNEESRVRGRKFYWHSEPRIADLTKEKPNQNSTFRAVRRGRKFAFEVRFERLKDTELANLIWVLEIGNNKNNAHKLGHGKSVGYGSARICVDKGKSVVFLLDKSLKIDTNTLPELSNRVDLKHIDEFLKVSNFDTRPDNVDYPKGTIKGETTIYTWFGLNRQGGETKKGTRDQNRTRIFNTLPNLLDERQELPMYMPSSNEPLSQKYTSNRNIDIDNDSLLSRDQNIAMQSQTNRPSATTVRELTKMQNEEKTTETVQQYGVYKAAVINTWLLPLKRDTKTMRSLESFVKDFERAQRENDNRYKDIMHLYKKAKEKLEGKGEA